MANHASQFVPGIPVCLPSIGIELEEGHHAHPAYTWVLGT